MPRTPESIPVSARAIELIMARLEELGKTESWLAAKVGTSSTTIHHILTAKTKTSTQLGRMCSVLKIPLFEVLPLDATQRALLKQLALLRADGQSGDDVVTAFEKQTAKAIDARRTKPTSKSTGKPQLKSRRRRKGD